MSSYNVHEAKSNLSRLLRKTAAGEEVIIMRDGKPRGRTDSVSGAGPET